MVAQEKWSCNIAELRNSRQFESNLLQEVGKKRLSFETVHGIAAEYVCMLVLSLISIPAEIPINETLNNVLARFDQETVHAKLADTPEHLEIANEVQRTDVENNP